MKKNYKKPTSSDITLHTEQCLLANSMIEGGKYGETGDPDTRQKHRSATGIWGEDGNYWD